MNPTAIFVTANAVIILLWEIFAELTEKVSLVGHATGYVQTISQWTWQVTENRPWVVLALLFFVQALVFHLFIQPWIPGLKSRVG